MSQQQDAPQQQPDQGSQGQSNVRVIPIFVEGRDEPVINRDFVDAGPQVHHQYEPPPMRGMPQAADLGFGREIPTFNHGSIFDRAKDFPVRNIRDEFFRDRMSPSRGESPLRNHMFNEPQLHRFGRGPSPQPQPQERQRTHSGSFEPQQQQQPPRRRTTSRNEDGQQQHQQAHHQQQQHQAPPQPAAPKQPQQQQSAPSQPQTHPQPAAAAAAPQKEATPPPAPKPKLGPIEKIQEIQRDVLDLMTKVEQFQGKTRRDREYLYLDEMLTQNLLKLDTVDTDGQENVKLARKEAVKCINRCLSVLEAKAEAAEDLSAAQRNSAEIATPEQQLSNTTSASSTVQMEIEHQPVNGGQASQEPVKQSSRGSIYDNHDPSTEQPPTPVPQKERTPQPKSKESTPTPAGAGAVAPPLSDTPVAAQ